MSDKINKRVQAGIPAGVDESALLRAFIKNAPHSYIILEESGTVVTINAALAHLLQCSENAIEGTTFVNLVATASRQKYFDSYRDFFNGTHSDDFRILLLRSNGSTVPVRLHHQVELETEAGIRQAIVAVMDCIEEERIAERVATLSDQIERRTEERVRMLQSEIRERERMEAAFRESQERQTLAFWGANMAWFEYDVSHELLNFSSRIDEMLGAIYSSTPIKGRDFTRRIFPDDRLGAEEAFRAHLKNETPVVDVQVRMQSDSNLWKWVTIRGRITEFDGDQKPLRMIGVIQDINETKQVEQEHALFFKHATDMFTILDRDGILRQVNPAVERCLGWDASEMIGQPALAFNHPEDVERGTEALNILAECKMPPLLEQRIRCKDGSYCWVATLAVPLSEHSIYIGIGRNITDQKEQEQHVESLNRNLEQLVAERSTELQQQKSYLDDAMSIGQMVYWEYDLVAGEFVFNDAVYDILRTTVAQEGGYRIEVSVFQKRFLPDREAPSLASCMANVPNADPAIVGSFEVPVRFADGASGHAMIRIRIEKDEEGGVLRVFGIAQDITAQKEMKVEIERQECLYQNLFETAPEPIFVADAPSGMLIDANERAQAYTGLTIDELRGMHITELHAKSNRSTVLTTFNKIGGCDRLESVLATLRHHSGAYRLVTITTRAVACGDKVYAIGIMTDIEAYRELIEQAMNGEVEISVE